MRLLIAAVLGVVFALPAMADCQCRALGQTFNQGQTACIFDKLARCEMNQNVASWKIISGSCLITKNEPTNLLPLGSQPVKQLIKATERIHVRAVDV